MVVTVPAGHVGEDHAISGRKASQHFDGVDGASSERDGDAEGLPSTGVELEESQLTRPLAHGEACR